MINFAVKHSPASKYYAEAAYTLCVNSNCSEKALRESVKFLFVLQKFRNILVKTFSISKDKTLVDSFVSTLITIESLKDFIVFAICEKDKITILDDIFILLVKKLSKSLSKFSVIILVPDLKIDISKLLSFSEKFFGSKFIYEKVEDKKIIAGAILIGENFMLDLSARATLKKLSNIIFSNQVC